MSCDDSKGILENHYFEKDFQRSAHFSLVELVHRVPEALGDIGRLQMARGLFGLARLLTQPYRAGLALSLRFIGSPVKPLCYWYISLS